MISLNILELPIVQLPSNPTEIEPKISENSNQRNLIKCAVAVCAVAAIGVLIFTKGDVLSLFQPRVNIEELKLNPWKSIVIPPVLYPTLHPNGTFFYQPDYYHNGTLHIDGL